MPYRNLLLLIASLFLFAGCASDGKMVSAEEGPPAKRMETADFQMPPKDLLAAVKKAASAPPLSLPIKEESKGTIVTDYKTYPGTWHVARRWQERTRYVVTVIPDWDEPTKRSRLQVSEETQQRAADIQEWQNAQELQRPERSAELLRMIREQVK